MTQLHQALDRDFVDSFCDRWHEAWNTHDPSRVVALCSPRLVLEQSSAPTAHGHEGIAASVRQLATASADYRFESLAPPFLSADGRQAIVPWRFTGTMTGPFDPPGFAPTGRRVSFEGDDHWEFEDGLMVRCRILFDANDVSVQMGAAPPPGSPGEKAAVLLQHLTARWSRARAGRAAGPGR